MERDRVVDASKTSVLRARVWLALGTMALVGLIALAIVLSLAGNAQARLVWAGALSVLAGTALFASGMHRRVRLPVVHFPSRRLAFRFLLLACLVMLALVVQSRSAVNVQAEPGSVIVVTWSQDPPANAVAGKPLLIRASVRTTSDVSADTERLFLTTGGLTALDGGGNWVGCTFTASPPEVNCTISTLEDEDTFEFFLILDVPPGFVSGTREAQEIEAFFQVQKGGGVALDANHGFQVGTSADLSITKLGDPLARAGEVFTYTLVVENFGPSNSRNVVVEDDIVASEFFTIVDDGACTTPDPSGAEQRLVCNVGTMAPGDRWSTTITVRSNETVTVQNSAQVSSHVTAGDPSSDILDPDPNSFNNRATAFTSVTDVADLRVTKTTAATSVTAGQTIAYTILVINTGPSEAENVLVADFLPPRILDNVQISASGGTCTPGTPPTSPAICNLGTMASGATETVNVTFTLDPSYPIDPLLGATIQNEVVALSDTFDPDNSDNRATVETTVTAQATKSLTATVVPATPIAGDEFHIDFTLSNSGPSTAQDAVLEAHFSAAVQDYIQILNVSAAYPPLSTCTTGVGDESVRCQVGDLRPGIPITGTLNLSLRDDMPPGNYPGAVTLTLSTPTPGSIISLILDLLIDDEADLAIFKVDTGSPATAGRTTSYTFVVVNLGPSLAEDVTVVDTLPAGFTYLDSTADCSATVGGFQCDLGDIAAGGQSKLLVTVGIDPSVAPGDYTDTATVSSSTDDPDTSNNTDTQVTRVQDVADVMVRKFGRPDQIVVSGELMTYTIMVDNLGPSIARNVLVTDTLDPDVTFVSATPSQGTCPTTPTGSGGIVGCTLGTLPFPNPFDPNDQTQPGRAEIELVVRANRDIGPPFDPISNRTEVSSTAQDPNLRNNLTERVTRVTAHSDLEVTKTAVGQNVQDSATAPAPLQEQADNVTAGTFITYTISVTNTGPSDATNVFVRDLVPAQIEPRGATITRGDGLTGSCILGGLVNGSVLCNIDTLGVYPVTTVTSTATVVITGFVASSTPEGFFLNNNVTVGSDNYDPDNTDSLFHNQTLVNARADLVISKTDDPDPVIAGDLPASLGGVIDGKLLKYTITVTNTGPSDALNVVVSDTLPVDGLGNPQVVFLNSTLKSFGADLCSADPIHPEKVRCRLGTMKVSQVVSFDILVFVKPDIVPAGSPFIIITNTADVLSDTHDPVSSNNRATQTTRVEAKADLVITKVDNPDPVVAGTQVVYIISFSNKGPSTARIVTITDTLPAGMLFNRCEPVDPDDEVTCAAALNPSVPGQIVTLTQLKVRGTVQLPGDLHPGEGYAFAIVADVDPGYVLDFKAADPLNPTTNPDNPARDTAYIASETTSGTGGFYPDVNPDDNQDTALTRVISSADLSITKTDSFGTVPPLGGDPATQGTIYTYTMVIKNGGPSDAASVRFIDQLPQGLILDPAVISPAIAVQAPQESDPEDPVVLDTGLIIIDLGRVNDTSLVTITIQARVALTTRSGTLTNVAIVQTIDHDNKFSASLKGINEVPPVNTTGNGAAAFRLSNDATQLTYQVSVADLQGTVTAAHIHCGAFGVAGPVGVTLDHITFSGTITQPNPANACGWTTLADVVAAMRSGGAYANVHTTFAPGGEVRGQIQPFSSPASTTTAPSIDPHGPAPTPDPNFQNNVATETTTVVSPAITIDKTISLDGTCPGTDNVAIGFIGQPVTYCYQVTNSGDTHLDFVRVVDFVTTIRGEEVIFNQEYRSTPGKDPLLPVAPGDTFIVSTTVTSDLLTDCNNRPDTAYALGVPVNSGRTVLAAVAATVSFTADQLGGTINGVVGDSDDALIETPCRGVDWRLQLPALDTTNCETWIQVQNVGNRFTKALLVLWGDPGPCPPWSSGPLKVECTGLLRPGSAWTWINTQLPAGAKSGILYSLNTVDTVTDGRGNQVNFADFACLALSRSIVGDYEEWLLFDTAYRNRGIYYAYSRSGDNNQDVDVLDFGAHQGEPTAVTVNRTCPGDNTPSVDVGAAYTGFSTDQEGWADPIAGGFAYYAPLLWATYGTPPDDLSTIIHIQNSGTECTSVEIWFQGQDNCLRYTVGDILALAPGEAYQFDPNTVVGPGWQGSAWLASSQPLGVLVDIIGRDLFGAYRGVPADSYVGFGDADNPNTFSLGSLVNYAPLTYREHNGWDTGIQVQNLSSTTNAKVKVYFTDNSGDIITTIVDWICPRGSQSFFLAAIANLPGSYIGAARIESQDWWSPGDPGISAPTIQSVVNTVKYQDLTRAMPLELVAYNALQEQFGYDWQLGLDHPGMATLGVPFLARGNRGVTSELAVQNLNPNPGFTDFAIFIYDQNRLIDYVCQKLNQKQVEYIDAALWPVIPQGFLGSVVVQAQFTTQFPGEPALGAVAVERIGRTLSDPDLPGDESKAFEAFPLFNRFKVEPTVQCPGLP